MHSSVDNLSQSSVYIWCVHEQRCLDLLPAKLSGKAGCGTTDHSVLCFKLLQVHIPAHTCSSLALLCFSSLPFSPLLQLNLAPFGFWAPALLPSVINWRTSVMSPPVYIFWLGSLTTDSCELKHPERARSVHYNRACKSPSRLPACDNSSAAACSRVKRDKQQGWRPVGRLSSWWQL
jgi:hypothetical protein